MVAFIQKAHGCIFFYEAIEAQEAQLAISDRLPPPPSWPLPPRCCHCASAAAIAFVSIVILVAVIVAVSVAVAVAAFS